MSKLTGTLCVGLGLAALCAGCASSDSNDKQKQKQTQEPAEEAPAPDAAMCADRTDALAEHLLPAARTSRIWVLDKRDLTPVESDAGRTVDRSGAAISVTNNAEVLFNGEMIGTGANEKMVVSELRARLAVELEQTERSIDSASVDAMPLYFSVAGKTPVALLQSLLATVPVKMQPRLLVVGPKKKPPAKRLSSADAPSVMTFRAELDKRSRSGPAERAVYIAETMERAIGLCTPLIKLFGDLASTNARDKGLHLAKAAPVAIQLERRDLVNGHGAARLGTGLVVD